MSDEMRDLLARMLGPRSEPVTSPRVLRDGAHVIVQGPNAPLRDDFVSSGRRPNRAPAPTLTPAQ